MKLTFAIAFQHALSLLLNFGMLGISLVGIFLIAEFTLSTFCRVFDVTRTSDKDGATACGFIVVHVLTMWWILVTYQDTAKWMIVAGSFAFLATLVLVPSVVCWGLNSLYSLLYTADKEELTGKKDVDAVLEKEWVDGAVENVDGDRKDE